MDLKDFIVKPSDLIEVKEVDVKEKLTIFNILDAMTIDKKQLNFNDDLVKKSYDQYMINRWISMNEELFYIAELLNTTTNLTDAQHFDLLISTLPKDNFNFRYVKRKKDINASDKRYIAHYFEIGLHDADEYIRQMDQDDIDEVLKKYKYGKNQMIKI